MTAWEHKSKAYQLEFCSLSTEIWLRATSWILKEADNRYCYFLGPKVTIAGELKVDWQIRRTGRQPKALQAGRAPLQGAQLATAGTLLSGISTWSCQCSHNQVKLFCRRKTKEMRKEAYRDRVGAIILLFVTRGINKLLCRAFHVLWIRIKLNWTKQTIYY